MEDTQVISSWVKSFKYLNVQCVGFSPRSKEVGDLQN